MSGIGPKSQGPEYTEYGKRLHPEEEVSGEMPGQDKRVKKEEAKKHIPLPTAPRPEPTPKKTPKAKRLREGEEEVVKADKTALKALKLEKPLSPEQQYEAHVDDFISKLVDVGYKGDIKVLKHKIIEENTLNLSFQRLSALPCEIGNLVNLKYLELNNNQLTSLPSELGNLTNLKRLYLSSNQLTALPSEIGNLTLESLYLSANQLTSLPSELGNLTNLKRLYLSLNHLTSLPSELGNLTNLERLNLSDNQLASLPSEIGNLTNLTYLELRSNQLTSLPSEFGNLTNLTYLELHNNQLTSLPSEFGNLINLTDLVLHHNQLTSLPSELGNLTNLKRLYLTNNQLTSLPSEFGNLTNLIVLHLIDNQLISLPATVRNLTNLAILLLGDTPIAAQGDETSLGRRELIAHFGDRCDVEEEEIEQMPANTKEEEVYAALDKQSVRINRKKLAETKLPELRCAVIENGDELIEKLMHVSSKLEYDNEQAPGYISYKLLAGDFASHADAGNNWEKIQTNVLSRLTGYLHTLYNMPLEEGETGGWQMYEAHRPVLKKALSFILTEMAALKDKDQISQLFLLFVNGMLHCPTGQKEAIDTVCLALREDKTGLSSNLQELASDIVAKKKNAFFKTAVLTKGAKNSQNVHLISTYENRLKEKLGLSNILEYDERMGTMGKDPFNRNPANVLKVFYDLVTPSRLADWMLEKTPSKQDLALRKKLNELSSYRMAALPNEALQKKLNDLKNELKNPDADKPLIQSHITQVESLLHRQKAPTRRPSEEELAELITHKSKVETVKQFKPLTTQVLLAYLRDNQLIHTDNPDWWQDYFSDDPSLEETATLTHQGAIRLLTHLGYVGS